MACKYKRVSPSLIELPEELHVDIFFRLPVRSLLSCKCVCNLFRTVIQNPDFEHTRRTLNRSIPSSACTSELLLVQSDDNINIVSIDNTTNNVISSTQLTSMIPYIRKLSLVGSCNGLVCFYALTKRKWDDMLILWNPVTGKTKYLPEPPKNGCSYKSSTEFCFVPETNDYVVLTPLIYHSIYFGSRIHVAVYKMSTDSWTSHRSNISTHWLKHQMTPVFVNGSFHWGANNGDDECNIVSYNPKDEEFRQIETPINHHEQLVSDTQWNIAVIEESLGVMYWNYRGIGEVKIFKMKYGVKDSWLWFRFRNSLLSPLLGHWKGNLITTDSSNLHLYDYHTYRRKQWIPQSGLPRLCSFLDTMAPYL